MPKRSESTGIRESEEGFVVLGWHDGSTIGWPSCGQSRVDPIDRDRGETGDLARFEIGRLSEGIETGCSRKPFHRRRFGASQRKSAVRTMSGSIESSPGFDHAITKLPIRSGNAALTDTTKQILNAGISVER